jgi:hypothetical protein
MLNKIADLEKMVQRKIVHHDEFCYWLKLMYLFLLHPVYWVPQNSRNKSMRQCQLMLEDNEKNNKKILYHLDLKIWRLKMCSFDLIYLFKY